MIDGLEHIIQALWLTSENSEFYLSATGILQVKVPSKEYDGRAHLALSFPFETDSEYVCVQNENKEEIGMIRILSDFDDKTVLLLKAELKKKYFAPKIKKIKKLKEQYGSTYWDCETDHGMLSFTVKDPHRHFLRAGEDRVFVLDVNGCRYEIPSIRELDKKSLSKIELYL